MGERMNRKRSPGKGAEVFHKDDIDRVLTALEISNPSLSYAYYLVRMALGIEIDPEEVIWGEVRRIE